MRAWRQHSLPAWQHVTHTNGYRKFMDVPLCSQVQWYLEAVDPAHDIAAVTEMLQAILDVEDIGSRKATVKCVAVLIMLGQEMCDLATAFMREYIPSAETHWTDGWPAVMDSVISALISQQASCSFLDKCFSFLRGFCTDQGHADL